MLINNKQENNTTNSNIGVFIDIDGVVLHGGKPFEWTKEAMHSLWNNEVPFVFVTNGTYSSDVIVKMMTDVIDLPFTKNHFIVAPSPMMALTEFHDKRVLACGQEDSIKLAKELGFTDYITIPELVDIFPEFDYVDHKRRKYLLDHPADEELKKKQEEFRPIEAIILLGEPINWESALQLLLDVLMTNGDLRTKFKVIPYPHLPIIACNRDITFKGAAPLPRFGHGAFLECLETLYNKVTKNELVYEQMMGKPEVVTYEFSASQLQKVSTNGPVNKFFIIGDNPDVDVKGANLYKAYLHNEKNPKRHHNHKDIHILQDLDDEGECDVESILVCTGVYNPQNDLQVHLDSIFDSGSTTSDLGSSGSMDDSILNGRMKRSASSTSLVEQLNKNELVDALSRNNSFIGYFDNKLNVPDLIVDNLKDAVDYILRFKKTTCNV